MKTVTLLHNNGFFRGFKVLSQQKGDWDISPNTLVHGYISP